MKRITMLLALFALFMFAASAYAAGDESQGQIMKEAEQLKRAARDFNGLINAGGVDHGRFVSSYEQLDIKAGVLAREVGQLQSRLEANGNCRLIGPAFSKVSDRFTDLDRSLENVQYQFSRSDIIRSWRRVRIAYDKLLNVIQRC